MNDLEKFEQRQKKALIEKEMQEYEEISKKEIALSGKEIDKLIDECNIKIDRYLFVFPFICFPSVFLVNQTCIAIL